MRGFTLVEILIALGLVALIAGFTIFISFDAFRRASFSQDRDLLVAALQRARSQAQHNTCLGSSCTDGRPHGVAVLSDPYEIFQGLTYATRDVDVDDVLAASVAVHHSGLTEIVFAQVTAQTTAGDFILSDDESHSATISVASNGRISWTH